MVDTKEKTIQENEERLKKMKSLLLAANKKLTEYKENCTLHANQLQEKDDKIKELIEGQGNLESQLTELKSKFY